MQSVMDPWTDLVFAKAGSQVEKHVDLIANLPDEVVRTLKEYRSAMSTHADLHPVKELCVRLGRCQESDRTAAERVIQEAIPCEFTMGRVRSYAIETGAVIALEIESPQLLDLVSGISSRLPVRRSPVDTGLRIEIATSSAEVARAVDGLSLEGLTAKANTIERLSLGNRRIAMLGQFLSFSDRLLPTAAAAVDQDRDKGFTKSRGMSLLAGASGGFIESSSCGAGSKGRAGFQSNNTCSGRTAGDIDDVGPPDTPHPKSPKGKRLAGKQARKEATSERGVCDRLEKLTSVARMSDARRKANSAIFRKVTKDEGVSNERLNAYAKTLTSAMGGLPENALTSAHGSMGKLHFHSSVKGIKDEITRRIGKEISAKPLGFFSKKDGGLHVNGVGGARSGVTRRGVYAHELAHAVDMQADGSMFSDTKPWLDAYNTEINVKTNPLSRYATVNPQEGFAEFMRLLVEDRDKAKKEFPLSTAAIHAAYGEE